MSGNSFYEYLGEKIKGKRILILGFGKEGQSTYKVLRRLGNYGSLHIADVNKFALPEVDSALISGALTITSGQAYQDCLDDVDIVFKSPGIVLKKPYLSYSCEITSQTEIFLGVFNRQVIGISGTKGKSTVSSLLHHILQNSGINASLAGNIGKAVFDIVDEIEDSSVIVLELSCHQLEFCRISPAVAVLLNLYEDHLDHYGSFEKYVDAKRNIFLHQHPLDSLYCSDYLFYQLRSFSINNDLRESEQANALIKDTLPDRQIFKSRLFRVSNSILPFDSLESLNNVKLTGEHNYQNCAFVYEICRSFGISDAQFIYCLRTFTPLRHRLEFIGNINGVDYYDDSISTTCESAISAICAVKNAATALFGGMDRGIDYEPLISFLRNCKLRNLIFMYESGRRIMSELLQQGVRDGIKLHYRDDLRQAAGLAMEITEEGQACVLSPASASYGDFKNFEERGDFFKKIINNIA